VYGRAPRRRVPRQRSTSFRNASISLSMSTSLPRKVPQLAVYVRTGPGEALRMSSRPGWPTRQNSLSRQGLRLPRSPLRRNRVWFHAASAKPRRREEGTAMQARRESETLGCRTHARLDESIPPNSCALGDSRGHVLRHAPLGLRHRCLACLGSTEIGSKEKGPHVAPSLARLSVPNQSL
jgi:hypothetical protein